MKVQTVKKTLLQKLGKFHLQKEYAKDGQAAISFFDNRLGEIFIKSKSVVNGTLTNICWHLGEGVKETYIPDTIDLLVSRVEEIDKDIKTAEGIGDYHTNRCLCCFDTCEAYLRELDYESHCCNATVFTVDSYGVARKVAKAFPVGLDY